MTASFPGAATEDQQNTSPGTREVRRSKARHDRGPRQSAWVHCESLRAGAVGGRPGRVLEVSEHNVLIVSCSTHRRSCAPHRSARWRAQYGVRVHTAWTGCRWGRIGRHRSRVRALCRVERTRIVLTLAAIVSFLGRAHRASGSGTPRREVPCHLRASVARARRERHSGTGFAAEGYYEGKRMFMVHGIIVDTYQSGDTRRGRVSRDASSMRRIRKRDTREFRYRWLLQLSCRGEHSVTALVIILTTYQGTRKQRSGWKTRQREQAACQRLLVGEVSSLVFSTRVP